MVYPVSSKAIKTYLLFRHDRAASPPLLPCSLLWTRHALSSEPRWPAEKCDSFQLWHDWTSIHKKIEIPAQHEIYSRHKINAAYDGEDVQSRVRKI